MITVLKLDGMKNDGKLIFLRCDLGKFFEKFKRSNVKKYNRMNCKGYVKIGLRFGTQHGYPENFIRLLYSRSEYRSQQFFTHLGHQSESRAFLGGWGHSVEDFGILRARDAHFSWRNLRRIAEASFHEREWHEESSYSDERTRRRRKVLPVRSSATIRVFPWFLRHQFLFSYALCEAVPR